MSAVESAFNGHAPTSLADLVGLRAQKTPDHVAMVFVQPDRTTESITYAQLGQRAEQVASRLRQLGPPGHRALLLYPASIDFLTAFCGCALAGWTPVPTCFPRPARAMPRLDSIAEAAQAAVLLAPRETLETAAIHRWSTAAAELPRIASDDPLTGDDADALDRVQRRIEQRQIPTDESLGLLQFTSGSTSQPKGVMIRHANLMANLEAIRLGFGLDFVPPQIAHQLAATFWLPPFHDMGLIGGLLTPLYIGVKPVVCSPQTFLNRPLTWLELISQYRAQVTVAPNFAYQFCVDRIDGSHAEHLDLSCLRVASCGAEPIQARTLEQFANRFAHTGFRPEALMPCYGLAESTLYVTGKRQGTAIEVATLNRAALTEGRAQPAAPDAAPDEIVRSVSCGVPALDTQVEIVDPQTCCPVPKNQIGEIWIRGSSVAEGYWPTPETSAAPREPSNSVTNGTQETNNLGSLDQFAARLEGQDDGSPRYYRTGDLGFLRSGQLHVTGRLKDLIILRGRNHYPQDIEATVRETIGPESGTGMVAAFAAEGPHGEGLALVAETDRATPAERLPELVRDIRRRIIDLHEVDPRHVVLVRPASIPVTSSGKIRRSDCRQRFHEGALATRHRWDRSEVRVDGALVPAPLLPSEGQPVSHHSLARSIQDWMVQWLAMRGGNESTDISPDRSLDDWGLDSLSVVELSAQIEDWLGVRLTPNAVFEHPSPKLLASYLADEVIALRSQRVNSSTA